MSSREKVFVSLAFYVNYFDSIITQAWVVFFVVCVCRCACLFLLYASAAKVDILLKGKLIQSCGTCVKASMISVVGKFQQRTHTHTHTQTQCLQILCDTMIFLTIENCSSVEIVVTPSAYILATNWKVYSMVCVCLYEAQLTCKLLQYLFARVLRNMNMFCIVYKLQ